ncbi:MAG TPA: hypothetical protein VLL48_02970, partial [Longimicrobiales bacterium]|nr:hypothetical protein [Longimicrobiales bacterium]
MTVVYAALVGLAAGLHVATWGMFKDAPHEGFTWSTYLRSPTLATLLAVALSEAGGLVPDTAGGVVVLFGVTYGLERGLVEFYKTFLREQDQSKYTIPMQFSVGGEVVESRAARLGAGALYLAAELAVLAAVWWLDRSGPELGTVATAAVVGSAGGWISAFGGAWKDAPVEGFHLLKFFRSPILAFLFGLLVATFTTSYPAVFVGSLGYTVATIETWKTFSDPGKDRGKFMDQDPGHPEMLERRWRFVPVYVAVWLGVL